MVLEQFIASSNTVSLSSIFVILLTTLSMFGYLSLNQTYFFGKNNRINHLSIKLIILLAYIFIFFAIFSFFSAMKNYFTFLFYFIGLCIFIFTFIKRKLVTDLRWIIFSFIFILIYSINSDANNDFNYHFDHINLYKNYPITLFTENMSDYRIKFNSAYILLNSLTYIPSFEITIKFLSSFTLSLFIIDLRNYLLKKDLNLYLLKYLSLFILISVFITLSKFKNIGTDYTAHLFYLSLVIFYLNIFNSDLNFFKSKNFFLIISTVISMLIVLKISMILTSLILVHYLLIIINLKNFQKILSFFLIIPLLVLFLWIFQNIELSNCIIFPISKLCLVSESEIYPIVFENTIISLYAKDIVIDYYSMDLSDLIKLNSISSWFKIWLLNGFLEVLEKFMPILIIFNLSIYKSITKNVSKNIKNEFIKFNLIFIIIIFISVLVWFLQAPSFRFGFSFLVLFFFFINIYFIKIINFDISQNISSQYLNKLFNIFLVLFIFYQLIRIYNY